MLIERYGCYTIRDIQVAYKDNYQVKYALLNILVPKVGSDAILDAEPDFMWKCLRAMDSLVISPQITGLILAFLYRRIEETIPGIKFKGQNTRLQENQDNKVSNTDKDIKHPQYLYISISLPY